MVARAQQTVGVAQQAVEVAKQFCERTSGEDHLRAWTVFDGEVDTRQTWAVARVAGSQRAAPVVCSDLTLCLELSVLANSLFVYYCICFL